MKIVMIGAGYVGLVSGGCFADFGHMVTVVDTDKSKIEKLNNGEIPIFEPGLETLLRANVEAGRLTFTDAPAQAIADAEVVFICVGTPTLPDGSGSNLSYVFQAAEDIAKQISGYTVIVDKSTVPVGTGDRVEEIIRNTNPDADFDVVSNPEFLREGAAISDFKRPDRVIIGAENERAFETMKLLYRALFINETPYRMCNRRTAELIKYAANAFLAMKISFINEIADLCEQVGADVQQVAKGIGTDNRIGSKFLHAGPGYGGSCFPKDTLALSQTGHENGAPISIVDAVISSNERRKHAMTEKVIAACGGSVEGLTIAVLGLTFKPNTDDMRDAPSLTIVPGLQKAGAIIQAYDPEGHETAARELSDLTFCDSAYDCLEGADAAVIITEWDQFRALDLKRIESKLSKNVLVDLRNIYTLDEIAQTGLEYHSIGRKFQ